MFVQISSYIPQIAILDQDCTGFGLLLIPEIHNNIVHPLAKDLFIHNGEINVVTAHF